MARIRSIHPGLWTDETYVSLSPFARLLFLGIWNECDDMGSFEWSPVKLKMRLLPADSVDVVAMLEELTEARCIMAYEAGSKRYGAVRNFCQYQRPKKPNSVHPQTDAVRNWVNVKARSARDGGELGTASDSLGGELTPPSAPSSGELHPPSTRSSGEPVGKRFPTGGEKSRQRKEGGDSSVTNVTGAAAPPADPKKAMFDAGVALLGEAGLAQKAARALIAKWLHGHGDVATMAALASAAGRADPVSWIEGRLRTKVASDDEASAASRATAERYRRMAIPGPPTEAEPLRALA
ncbi:hypothetical protein U1701_13210 [Sphingomonas sp. PB2P19]|uniref:hypothetical protein n=1 Tax=Sphingomonas rhamnosi TaxID=3096156 RepID=UPI002FC62C6B